MRTNHKRKENAMEFSVDESGFMADGITLPVFNNDFEAGETGLCAEMQEPNTDMMSRFVDPNLPTCIPALNPPPFEVLQEPPEGTEVSLPDGIPPVGYRGDGTPIFNVIPYNVDEIEGDFIVQQIRLFPPRTEYVEIPAKGPERDAKIAEYNEIIKSELSSQEILTNIEMDYLDQKSQSIEDEMSRMEWEEKADAVRNEQHERDMAKVNRLTVEQYRVVNSSKLTQVNPYNPYMGGRTGDPELFKDDNGDMFRVCQDGRMYRVDEDGSEHLIET